MQSRQRTLLILGSAIYSAWYFLFQYLLSPQGYDSLLQRLVFSFIAVGTAMRQRPLFGIDPGRFSDELFGSILLLATMHSVFLSSMNQWDFVYSVGFLILFAVCLQLIDKPRHLLAYTIAAILAASVSGLLAPPADPEQVRHAAVILAGLISFSAMSFANQYAYNREAATKRQLIEKLDQERAVAIQSSKMSALGEMAAGVAHEINNPLAIISLTAEDLRTHLGAEHQESVDRIERTVERIAKIVRSLRAFSRQSDNDPMVPTTVKTIVDEGLELVRSGLKSKQVAMAIEYRCPETTEVLCRPYQLVQVMINLINNAIDSIADVKRKDFKPEIHISVVQRGETVQFRVRDNGTGIPDSIRDRIMEPFFTTKAPGKGTGLGLSVSKGIVESHLGTLWIEVPPPGSTGAWFVIELPHRAGQTSMSIAA